ncbi:MAG: hypothetical protein IPK83_04460 [Planctomycetes bacterium]|nr:hypothetical protein [Planctomycetota bacterium]
MSTNRPEFEWFEPAILAPGFFNPVVNAAAEEELGFLSTQLDRHLFARRELPGAEMHDHHGFRRAMAMAFGVKESSLGYGRNVVPNLFEILAAAPPRRTAILARGADRLIEADVQRFLTFADAVSDAARKLADARPQTQLLMFLLGPPPAFASIDAGAKRRAELHAGLKVTAGDITLREWNAPRDFDLGPSHQWTLSHADWYYCSRGHLAAEEGEKWHCIEHDDRITFIRAADGVPCFEGIFARLPQGMQLVGIRYESDDAIRQLSLVGEDPFTAFRKLCQIVGIA